MMAVSIGVPEDFDLKGYLQEKRDLVNQALTDRLNAARDDRRLVRAMGHSLNAGGKRLRPILCLAAAEVVCDAWRTVLPAACALEMIHTYSLIHDDLPAMDNDRLRRGAPTCHVAFDEATAILAGDGLLTLAFETLCDPENLRMAAFPERWLRAAHIIAKAAGHQGMVEGQMRDMAAEGHSLCVEELERLHGLKTGALIRASVEVGALLAGAGTDAIGKLTEYARGIGLAFQVTDDILNVTGDASVMGKAAGTDADRGKNTYPSLLGLTEAKHRSEALIQQAVEVLACFDDRAIPLQAIAGYIISRKR